MDGTVTEHQRRWSADAPPPFDAWAEARATGLLRFYEDLDYPEIAQVLGVAEVIVRSHVHRGLVALRAELSEHEEDQ
jgi:DNA-directed RNA polymerase specialized sigma24 family protein